MLSRRSPGEFHGTGHVYSQDRSDTALTVPGAVCAERGAVLVDVSDRSMTSLGVKIQKLL